MDYYHEFGIGSYGKRESYKACSDALKATFNSGTVRNLGGISLRTRMAVV